MKTYITYDAGVNNWYIDEFDTTINWHNDEFRGTFKECKEYSKNKKYSNQSHYPNAPYESIWDY